MRTALLPGRGVRARGTRAVAAALSAWLLVAPGVALAAGAPKKKSGSAVASASSSSSTSAVPAGPSDNPLSAFPAPPVATTSSTPTVVNNPSTASPGNSSLSGGSAIAIAIGAVVVLAGISFYIWRDARRRAPVKAGASAGGGEGRARAGSKPPPKPRKPSPAERRRRKRGRARR
ncbi:MAG: hypothetical protein ACRDNK_05300 [Solirubrobacteraceae bacterium]